MYKIVRFYQNRPGQSRTISQGINARTDTKALRRSRNVLRNLQKRTKQSDYTA